MPRSYCTPEFEEVTMMDPLPRGFITVMAARAAMKCDRTLSRQEASISAAVTSSRPPAIWMPAWDWRTSSRPCRSSAAVIAAESAASSVTSRERPSARPPTAPISAATEAARSATRSVTTTVAPALASASAPARPIPEPAPVTKATRSLSSTPAPSRFPTAAALQDRLRGNQHTERCGQHHRPDGIDLRRHAAPDRGEDIDRQRGLRPGHEEGDDEIVKAEGEGEEEAREDRRRDLRQRHLPERAPGRGAEIGRSLDQAPVHARHPRPHDDDDERHGEEPVRGNERADAEVELRRRAAERQERG